MKNRVNEGVFISLALNDLDVVAKNICNNSEYLAEVRHIDMPDSIIMSLYIIKTYFNYSLYFDIELLFSKHTKDAWFHDSGINMIMDTNKLLSNLTDINTNVVDVYKNISDLTEFKAEVCKDYGCIFEHLIALHKGKIT